MAIQRLRARRDIHTWACRDLCRKVLAGFGSSQVPTFYFLFLFSSLGFILPFFLFFIFFSERDKSLPTFSAGAVLSGNVDYGSESRNNNLEKPMPSGEDHSKISLETHPQPRSFLLPCACALKHIIMKAQPDVLLTLQLSLHPGKAPIKAMLNENENLSNTD